MTLTSLSVERINQNPPPKTLSPSHEKNANPENQILPLTCISLSLLLVALTISVAPPCSRCHCSDLLRDIVFSLACLLSSCVSLLLLWLRVAVLMHQTSSQLGGGVSTVIIRRSRMFASGVAVPLPFTSSRLSLLCWVLLLMLFVHDWCCRQTLPWQFFSLLFWWFSWSVVVVPPPRFFPWGY